MTSPNWPELGLTAALVLITGFYAWATYKILRANQAVVQVMRDQIEQQTRPYVSVGIHQVPRDPTFYLRIANTGRTAAQHLRLTLDRAFHRYARQQEGENLASFHAFAEEIQSFGPGEELLFALAQDFEIFGEKADRSRVPLLFSVTAQYGYGTKRVSESATIDLRPYLKSQIKPDALVAEVRQLREKAEKIGQELRMLVSRLAERGQ